jgi:hypothetical protein
MQKQRRGIFMRMTKEQGIKYAEYKKRISFLRSRQQSESGVDARDTRDQIQELERQVKELFQ